MGITIDTSEKGRVSANSPLANGRDPRDLPLSHDTVEDMKNMGTHCIENGVVSTKTRITVHSGSNEGALRGQGNVMASAKTALGHGISDPGQINENSLMTVRGVESNVKSLMASGLLAKTPDGTYYDSEGPVPGSPEFTEQTKEELVPGDEYEIDFKGEYGEVVGGMKERIGDRAVDGHMNQILSRLATGEDCSDQIGNLATALGATPESIVTVVDEMVSDMLDAGCEFITRSTGQEIDANQIVEEIMSTWEPRKIQGLLRSLYLNDVRGIQGYFSDYLMKNRQH